MKKLFIILAVVAMVFVSCKKEKMTIQQRKQLIILCTTAGSRFRKSPRMSMRSTSIRRHTLSRVLKKVPLITHRSTTMK